VVASSVLVYRYAWQAWLRRGGDYTALLLLFVHFFLVDDKR
jgi:hypothetical protein